MATTPKFPTVADQLVDLLRSVAVAKNADAVLDPDDCDALVREIARLKDRAEKAEDQLANANMLLDLGVREGAEEALRQINEEGFTARHDDQYTHGALAQAGAAYALAVSKDFEGSSIQSIWPCSWERCWWKPSSNPKRNLAKAVALLAAERRRIERLEKEGGAL